MAILISNSVVDHVDGTADGQSSKFTDGGWLMPDARRLGGVTCALIPMLRGSSVDLAIYHYVFLGYQDDVLSSLELGIWDANHVRLRSGMATCTIPFNLLIVYGGIWSIWEGQESIWMQAAAGRRRRGFVNCLIWPQIPAPANTLDPQPICIWLLFQTKLTFHCTIQFKGRVIVQASSKLVEFQYDTGWPCLYLMLILQYWEVCFDKYLLPCLYHMRSLLSASIKCACTVYC